MSTSESQTYQRQNRSQVKDTIIPKYMGTFADLMTLLLCFFVLLVAMAELDALKYKMVVRSMENAFGVDSPKQPTEIIKGTSVIQQRFSPTPDQPSASAHVFQAADSSQANLKTESAELARKARLNSLKQTLQHKFVDAIQSKLISLETTQDRVLIRINEQASFPSGDAHIKSAFLPVLNEIANVLADLNDNYIVAGHTDDVPVRSARYRSNWELSAARATSVVHALLANTNLRAEQFRIEAYADTQPLKANKTAVGRAINRRVEIGIMKP